MQHESSAPTGTANPPPAGSSATTGPWRESVSRGMLTVAAIVGPLLAAIGLFVGSTKREAKDVLVLVVGGLLLPALKLGHARSVRRRAIAAILILFAAAIYLIARVGFAGGLSAIMVTACILGVIVGGRGLGRAMMGVAALAYVVIGLLVVKRILLLDPREVDPLLLRNWLRAAASTSLLAVLLASVVDFVIRHVEANARATAKALEDLRRAHEAQRLLAELGAVLSPIRYAESLDDVAPLLVRDLADIGIFYVVQPDGELRRVAAAARAPDQAWIAESLIKLRGAVRRDHSAQKVLASREPLFRAIPPELIEKSAETPEHLRALQASGIKHILFVPLLLGEACLGVLALCSSSEPHRAEDVPLALEIGRRCALFIESARLHRSEKRALNDLQEADRRKDEFLAMLSHELRNPLTPILTAVEILARLEAGDEALGTKYRGVIVRQVRHMKRLLDDLIDVSRVSRGKIELQKERVELNVLLLQAVEVSRPLLVEKRHALSLELAPQAIALEADPVRLAQVFDNLINNSAKYTDPGGNLAIVSAVENGEAVVTVRDDGVGMTPELLERAFDLFVQGKRSLDRTQGGLGVGLTLVRALVDLHGGTVRALSEGPGRGSEMVVRLPLVPVAEQSPSSPKSPTSPTPPTPTPDRATAALRVLVIDDNVDAAQGLGQLLRLLGHEVTLAHDGPGALAAADAAPPDLVLLDIGLPGMDGYAVAAALRAGGHTRAALVAITGYGGKEDVQRSRDAGFDRHLVKPVDFAQLQKVSREVTANRPSIRSSTSSGTGSPT